jgi:hypothetical protein
MKYHEIATTLQEWYEKNFNDHTKIESGIDVAAYDWGYRWNSQLIVLCEDGLKYSNQTGGDACNHPIAQGILIPMSKELLTNPEVSGSGWWEGDANEFLDSNPRFKEYFKGNGKSEEAWINVKIIDNDLPAIITYTNSD